MSENSGSCPYLWLAVDPSLRLSYANEGHRCFALLDVPEYRPDNEYQQQYCLADAYIHCPRYQPPASDRPFDPAAFSNTADRSSRSPFRMAVAIALGVIALVIVWQLASLWLAPAPASLPMAALITMTPDAAVAPVVETPKPGLTETALSASAALTAMAATPAPAFAVITNTPTAATVLELLNRAIAEATRTVIAGPPTAIPLGVVTATSASTSTPLPLNTETAQAQIIMITVEALTTGTWTPAPALAQAEPPTPTATLTAAFTSTSTPTPTPIGTPTVESAATSPLTATLQLPFGITPAATNLVDGAPVAVVLGQFVNVRQGPNTEFPTIAVVLAGDQLSLIGRTENAAWLNVCCANGQPGWIAAYLLGTEIDDTILPIQPLESTPTPSVIGVLPDSLIDALRRT